MQPSPIRIYTDGSARGNPGRGGYGLVMISGKHRKEMSAGYRYTTNNRMELMAVIVALEQLKFEASVVDVYTDSKYVCEPILQKWIYGWIQKNFAKQKNPDLWVRFYKVFRKHQVKFHWIKGHAGHTENERCDELATQAADSSHLLIDVEYEKQSTPNDNLFG